MSQYVVNKIERVVSEVTVHGIPYHYDDRSGLWSIWNIAQYLRAAAVVADGSGIFMDWKNLNSDNKSPVLIKQILKINPEVYQLNFLSDVRLRVIRELCKPGLSSICNVSKIVNETSRNTLVENFGKMVMIDKTSRKLVKLPDWFLEKYSELKCKDTPIELQRNEGMTHPLDCFEYRTTVRFSDLDSNEHLNFSVYIKSCFDCASTVSLKGKLIHYTGDITMYPVLYISMEFLGECFVGDEIVLKMWQDDNEISKFSFVIYKTKEWKQVANIVCHLGLEKMKR